MADTKYTTGTVLAVTEKAEGEYEVEQLNIQSSTGNKAPSGVDSVFEIHYSFGPLKIDGYVNTDTFEIRVVVSVLGINLGTFVGNLKDGVSISVNLFLVKGSINLYLKNGNEVWVKFSLKVTFDGSFDKDVKILSF